MASEYGDGAPKRTCDGLSRRLGRYGIGRVFKKRFRNVEGSFVKGASNEGGSMN